MPPLPPKPPPTNGAMTWMPAAGTPNFTDNIRRTPLMFCVLSWTVSRSPSHFAVVECPSNALW